MKKKMAVAAIAALAVCAVGMVGVAAASATSLDNGAGESFAKNKLTSFAGAFTIKAGAVEVTCKKGKGTGEITGLTVGAEELTMEECKLGATSCTTATLAEGQILLMWTIRFGSGPEERPLLGMEYSAVSSFTCGTSTIKVTGGYLALMENKIREMRKAFLFKAVPNVTEFTVEIMGELKLKLEVSLNGEAFKAATMSAGTEEMVLTEEAQFL
ncbi:MAG TPA: hypothetical protein VGP17_10905 [Solirubrobacteraceae bacterium]|jgi:hypothetical protein|nr:hypothetical protein [Solirubrobacteraceae bacterium]